MTQKPDFGLQPKNLPLFQGLIENEGRSYSNWGLHRSTRPAVYAEPITYADVQSLVRDGARFPGPVNPVGSMLSTSSTFVNDDGTMVCLRKLDEVVGLERDAAGREVVRVQAGCRLKKLNSWLQSHGLEIPFQAEIGEASVGSVAAGDTKESSLGGPGYFSAHVTAVTYVDENGALRALSDLKDAPHSTNSNVPSAYWELSSNVASKHARRRSAGPTFRWRLLQLRPNFQQPC